LFSGQTDSAHSVIIENPDYGRMLFIDNELQSCSYDEHIYHETLVHPVMRALDHIDDKRVLVIGGAEGATVREVLRWGQNKVRSIDWVDIDGALVQICKTHLNYAPAGVYTRRNIHYYAQDIMVFLNNPNVHSKYHCIIIDLPDPDPNEHVLYRAEFWRLVRRALKTRGAVVSHTGPVEPGAGRQEGLDIIRSGAMLHNRFERGYAYHTMIPSFQGEWGFWMSCAPSLRGNFPDQCRVVSNHYQGTIFHWDRHWNVMN
jgi:spermidine synthase